MSSITNPENYDLNKRILDSSEDWCNFLASNERNDRIANSVLSGLIVWVVAIISMIVLDATGRTLTEFLTRTDSSGIMLGLIAIASVAVGAVAFLILDRRESRYAELRIEINKIRVGRKEDPNALANLVAKMLDVLPEVKKRKYDSALLYGVVSFFLTAFIFPFSLLIAIGIWLYFRYESTKDYDREIRKFENWKAELR